MAPNQILIIDDDEKLGKLLKEYLGKFGFEAAHYTNPLRALDLLNSRQPVLIILDVMMPEMEGFEVLRKIREKYHTPVIMLTARGEVSDRVLGLELGADDYLPKPFEPRELVARVKSVLRRGEKSSRSREERQEFGSLVVNMRSHQVTLNGEPVNLTAAEFELLKILVEHAGQVLSRDRLLDLLGGIEWDVYSRSVDVLVSRLRTKLQDDPKNPRFIRTVWGRGYQFIAPEEDYA
ncbi:MAG: response regulator transcription factor BfmR [Calditrichia bacterium]